MPDTYVRSRIICYKGVSRRKVFSMHFTRDGKDHRRDYVLDSGVSKHLVSRSMLTASELKTIRKALHPVRMNTASGQVRAAEEVQIFIKDLGIFVWAMILEHVPPLISMGKLISELGCKYVWSASGPYIETRNKKRLDCRVNNNVPMIAVHAINYPTDMRKPYTIGIPSMNLRQSGQDLSKFGHSDGETTVGTSSAASSMDSDSDWSEEDTNPKVETLKPVFVVGSSDFDAFLFDVFVGVLLAPQDL